MNEESAAAPAALRRVALWLGPLAGSVLGLWLHGHGDPTGPDAPAVRAQVRAAFADDDPAWIAACWPRFHDVLTAALRGCEWCFHVAASYHLWLRDYRPMYAANVEGTRTVIQAAAAAGCQRIVYTSTVGCLALPEPGAGPTPPVDETAVAAVFNVA